MKNKFGNGKKTPGQTRQPDISLENFSTHNSTFSQTPTLQKLVKTTAMTIEQQNDIILQQLRLKLQKNQYSESLLQQDPRYRQ